MYRGGHPPSPHPPGSGGGRASGGRARSSPRGGRNRGGGGAGGGVGGSERAPPVPPHGPGGQAGGPPSVFAGGGLPPLIPGGMMMDGGFQALPGPPQGRGHPGPPGSGPLPPPMPPQMVRGMVPMPYDLMQPEQDIDAESYAGGMLEAVPSQTEPGADGRGNPVPPPPPPIAEAEKEGSIQQKVKLIRNDHNEVFVDTGEPPQNFIREADPTVRFSQYPRWSKLLQSKDQIHVARTHTPLSIKCDLGDFDLTSLDCEFDVILMDPPWYEYVARTHDVDDDPSRYWTLAELKRLDIEAISANPSFLFIWAGDRHLDDARALLSHWGFRRCEDITWLKTIPPTATGQPPVGGTAGTGPSGGSSAEPTLVTLGQDGRRSKYQRVLDWQKHPTINVVGYDDDSALCKGVKEHCLMGLKGLVRRSLDGHFVHANIDTDVLVADVPPPGLRDDDGLLSTQKPIEMYDIIERFCLGRRKLELFATRHCQRAGWLSLGRDLPLTNFQPKEYLSWFRNIVEDANEWVDGTSGTDVARGGAAGHLWSGTSGMSVQQANLFRAAVGSPTSASLFREQNPLLNMNAYPNLTTYKGGKYEGTSQTLETLRPKSPPTKPAAAPATAGSQR